MACDDLVFDLVVGGLRKDAAGDELVLGGVGTAIDDSLGIGVANAGEGLELVGSSGVNVQRSSSCGRGGSCGLGGLGDIEDWSNGEQECGGKYLAAKIEHRGSPCASGCLTAEEYESKLGASMSKFALCCRVKFASG